MHHHLTYVYYGVVVKLVTLFVTPFFYYFCGNQVVLVICVQN